MKIVLQNKEDRVKIMKNAAKLKDAGPSYAKIYLKKDQHPAVRKEMNRLHQVVRTEKNKAENVGKNIVFDKDTRTVKVDNIIIDRFNPNFY